MMSAILVTSSPTWPGETTHHHHRHHPLINHHITPVLWNTIFLASIIAHQLPIGLDCTPVLTGHTVDDPPAHTTPDCTLEQPECTPKQLYTNNSNNIIVHTYSATNCSGGRDPLEIPPHHGGIGRPLAAKKLTQFGTVLSFGLGQN